MDGSAMGNACRGPSKDDTEPPSPTTSTRARKDSVGSQSVVSKEKSRDDVGGEKSDAFSVTSPPTAIPRPLQGMALPAWLKVIVKTSPSSAIDRDALLNAYRTFFPSSALPEDALIRMTLKLFHARQSDMNGKVWLVGVRWLNERETAAAFAAGHDPGVERRVSTEVQRNARRVMSHLLTVGGGKLPSRLFAGPTASAQSAPETQTAEDTENVKNAETAENGETAKDAETAKADHPPPPIELPPPPPPGSPPPESPNECEVRDFDSELCAIKADPFWNAIVCWMNDALVQSFDCNSYIETADIADAYDALSADESYGVLKPSIDVELMAKIVALVFMGAREAAGETSYFQGLAWRAMERSVVSEVVLFEARPLEMRKEAHKLLHAPDPDRTKFWLHSLFVPDYEATTSVQSLWNLYKKVFQRWKDTHPHLSENEFIHTVTLAFYGCKVVGVSEDYSVFLGIRMADTTIPAEEILHRHQKRDVQRLIQAGVIDPPKTRFAKKLLEDPLLLRQLKDHKGRPTPGSFISRTRRRAGGPEGEKGVRQPFGDEEPGFPGLSMKAVQKVHKREMAVAAKAVREEMQKGEEAKAKAVGSHVAAADAGGGPHAAGQGFHYVPTKTIYDFEASSDEINPWAEKHDVVQSATGILQEVDMVFNKQTDQLSSPMAEEVMVEYLAQRMSGLSDELLKHPNCTGNMRAAIVGYRGVSGDCRAVALELSHEQLLGGGSKEGDGSS